MQQAALLGHLSQQQEVEMTRRFIWFLVLLTATGLCQETFAQRRGRGDFSGRMRFNSQVSHVSSTHTGFPVPGFGFDYVHLAAVNPGAFNTSSLRSANFISSLPLFIPSFAPSAQIIIIQQPPVVIVQSSPVAEASPDWPPRSRPSLHEEAREPERATDPPRELEEIVFVRRNGTLFFAVAFSSSGGQLIYITREGLRRSISLSDLDFESTHRWNEERGTSLRLPS